MRISWILILPVLCCVYFRAPAQPKAPPKPNVYLGLDASGLKINNANAVGTLLLSLLKLKNAEYNYHLDTLAGNVVDPAFMYFVSGVLYSRNNQIILTFDVKTQADSIIHLPLIFADQKNLYEKLFQASDQILSTFSTLMGSTGKRKLSVMVVGEDIWGRSGNRAVTRDLLLKMSEVSPSQSASVQLTPRNVAMQYDYHDGNQKSLSEQTSTDAIMGVDVAIDSYPRVRGSLFIKEGKRDILFPPVYIPATDPEFLINLRKDFFQVLTHFIDSASQQWKQDSIAQFERNLDLDVPELTRMSHQYLRQKNYALALLMGYQALLKKKNPTSYFQIGSSLKLQNRINEARFTGDIGLSDFPDDPSLLLLQGSVLMELREFREAKTKIKASIVRNRDFYIASIPNPYIMLTRANLFLAEYDSAIRSAITYMKVHPRDAEATYYLGKSYFYKARYVQAIATLKMVDTLRLTNQNITSDIKVTLDRSYAALARIKTAAGDMDSSRIILNSSGSFGANYELSILYIKQVMRTGRLNSIDSLIELGIKRKTFNPNSIYFVLGLEAGNVAEEKGMSPEAVLALRLKQIDFFAHNFKLNPDDYRSERLIGSTYVRIGHTREGIPYLKDALEKDSTLIGYRLDLAEAELITGDFKGTLQLLNNGQLQTTSLMKNKSYYALVLCYRALARIFMNERDIRELNELKKIFARNVTYGGWEFETLTTWMDHREMSREQSAMARDLLTNMKKLFGK